MEPGAHLIDDKMSTAFFVQRQTHVAKVGLWPQDHEDMPASNQLMKSIMV